MTLRSKIILFFSSVLMAVCTQCHDALNPKPIDTLTNDIVLNEPKDVHIVEIGLYSAFRPIIPSTVIAGDFTADLLIHNGTFSQYRELGTKQITSANTSVSTLWGSIYNTIYIANFILERLPLVKGVPIAQQKSVTATAHFLRGYAYFIGLYTYGGIPEVLTTSIETNRNIPRASQEDILKLIIDDYAAALGQLTTSPANAGFASDYAVQAALARLNLYLGNWNEASTYASNVIASNKYQLDSAFADIVKKDFPHESIFEVGYTIADDPGTDNNIGLNNLFLGRREIIPSNQAVIALASTKAGERFSSISFNSSNLNGNDNGWSVAKYGTKDEDNNNVYVFRLSEMYLIRAEARARLGNITGPNGARADINILRKRADEFIKTTGEFRYNVPLVPSSITKDQMLTIIEEERILELAFEGHRWYDLVRTGRASAVMSAYSPNWRSDFELWPIPQREIQNNPALAGNQNPGY
jgi:hypothetical protein